MVARPAQLTTLRFAAQNRPLPPAPSQVRVVTERAYHALFMSNMLIRPSGAELEDFGEPDFVIFNAGGWGGGTIWGKG